MSRTPVWVSWVTLGVVASGVVHAAEFEVHENDNILHVDSGWVFSNVIAGFERLGDPAGIEGTATEATATYERTVNGVADQATVTLYPPGSPALDASLDAATVAEMLKALGDDKQPSMFATADKDGRNMEPVIRFVRDRKSVV